MCINHSLACSWSQYLSLLSLSKSAILSPHAPALFSRYITSRNLIQNLLVAWGREDDLFFVFSFLSSVRWTKFGSGLVKTPPGWLTNAPYFWRNFEGRQAQSRWAIGCSSFLNFFPCLYSFLFFFSLSYTSVLYLKVVCMYNWMCRWRERGLFRTFDLLLTLLRSSCPTCSPPRLHVLSLELIMLSLL